MLLSYLKTDSVDIAVLSNNDQGVKFWKKMGFVERHKYMYRLELNGVDVIVDYKNLKLGNDKYAFMERMVSDESVSKVLIRRKKKIY